MNLNANEVPKNINQAVVKNPFTGESYDFFNLFKFMEKEGLDFNELAEFQGDSIEFISQNLDSEVSMGEVKSVMYQLFSVNKSLKAIEKKVKITDIE